MLIDGTARILHDEDELVGLYCGDTFFWPDPWIDRWDAGDLFTWDSLWYDKWSGTFHYVNDGLSTATGYSNVYSSDY